MKIGIIIVGLACFDSWDKVQPLPYQPNIVPAKIPISRKQYQVVLHSLR